MNKLLRIIRIIVPVITLGVLIWIANGNFAIISPLKVNYGFASPSPFISFLKPEDRLGDIKEQQGETIREIIGEPVYFELSIPNKFFSTAEMELIFKNFDNSIVEIGVQTGEGWNYHLKTVTNEVLNNLTWDELREERVVLYQRYPYYKSIKDFLSNPPSAEKIATYHYNLSHKYIIDGYQANEEMKEINHTLRGEHELLTYIRQEPLFFEFWWQDMNRHQKNENVDFIVYDHQNKKIFSKSITTSGQDLQKTFINLSSLTNGVYKIQIKASDDIFIRKIRSRQQKMVFINKIYLGDLIDYSEGVNSATLYTNGKYIKAVTAHNEGRQILQVSDRPLSIQNTHEQYYLQALTGIKEVYSPKGDVLLQNNGLFSFAKEQYFNPLISIIDANFNPDAENIDFVIANYEEPQEQEEWKIKKLKFDLTKAYIKDGKAKFVISVPGLSLDKNKKVLLKNIKAVLYRK